MGKRKRGGREGEAGWKAEEAAKTKQDVVKTEAGKINDREADVKVVVLVAVEKTELALGGRPVTYELKKELKEGV